MSLTLSQLVLDVISSKKYFHKDTQISVWLNDWGLESCQFGAENWLTCREIYFQWLGGIDRYPYYKYLKTLYEFMNVYRKTFLWSLYQESVGISNSSGNQKDAGDNGVGHGSGMSHGGHEYVGNRKHHRLYKWGSKQRVCFWTKLNLMKIEFLCGCLLFSRRPPTCTYSSMQGSEISEQCSYCRAVQGGVENLRLWEDSSSVYFFTWLLGHYTFLVFLVPYVSWSSLFCGFSSFSPDPKC